jgi:uncharacterized protein involved in exopolysaccharide biosynthesis
MAESLPARPTSQKSTPTPNSNDEIDLIQVAHTLWSGRRTIIKTMAIFAVLGVIFALTSPTEYTASTTIVPQLSDGQSRMGGLSGLAAMAGINLNMGGTSEITPTVYPEIISSVPFQLELMETPLKFKDIEQPVSLYEYYTNYSKPTLTGTVMKYTVGLPSVINKAIKGSSTDEQVTSVNKNPLQLTQKQRRVQAKLKNLATIEYNNKDGYVILTCHMPEALPAAQLTQSAQELLQKYITEFKIQKARANFEFIEKRYNEIKGQYEEAQNALAAFQDRNRNMSSAIAQTELIRLKDNYNLAYEVYSELAKQLEQARIQVKEDTPVFTIIKPVSVPLERSKPKRAMLLFIWVFLGTIIGIGIIFGQQYWTPFKNHWINTSQAV